MILVNGLKTEAVDTNAVILDGVYLGVICNVGISDAVGESNSFNCKIYIPELYGEYSVFEEYPYVLIPEKQDSDDTGHTPQIGELVKVAFDDGNSNSGRLVNVIPTDSEVALRNANYIKYGVLPTTILDIDDPSVLQKMLEWLSDAYYVTTGKYKNQLKLKDFANQKFLESKQSFKNYFLSPLSIPFATYLSISESAPTPPYFLSNIYLYADVILKTYTKNRKDLVKIYNDMVEFFKAMPDYQVLKDDRITAEDKNEYKIVFVSCLLSGIVPSQAKILFPDVSEDVIKTINNCNYNYDNDQTIMRWWNAYLAQSRLSEYFSPAQYVFNNLNDLESEWAKACASWETGLNSILANNDNINLKRAIILCFTIFPWITYLLLGYELSSSSVFSPEVIKSVFAFWGKEYVPYVTMFKDEKEYTKTITKLSDLLHKSDLKIKEFVTTFQKTMKNLFTEESWKDCNMDKKFERLLKISETWTTVTPNIEYNSNTTQGKSYTVPIYQVDFKSYEDYHALGGSRRALVDAKATPDSNGIMKIGKYYCVAMGQYYTGGNAVGTSFKLGATFKIGLSTGIFLNVVIIDAKAAVHTRDNYRVDKNNGSVLEFIVDKTKVKIVTGNFGTLPAFEGTITSVVETDYVITLDN